MLRILAILAAPLALVLLVTPAAVLAADTRSSADTFVDGANTTTRTQNYGTQGTIRLRNSGQRLAFVRFPNPTSSPSSAELRLRVDTVNVAGSVEVRRITSNWAETSVTYNTRPPIATATIASRNMVAGDVGTVVVFDITSLVQDWAANPAGNFGLAVVASAGSPAQVYFESKEAGASLAPVLRTTDGPAPSDNKVTVAPTGGDYTDPVVAANNALSGDQWCSGPTTASPCLIEIREGVYFLSATFDIPAGIAVDGAGMTNTLLIARPGVATAAIARGPSVSDLSLINHQASASATAMASTFDAAFRFTTLAVDRVGMRASGGGDNASLDITEAGENLNITDCELTATGGQKATGVFSGLFGVSNVTITRAHITVTGAATLSSGIDATNRITMRDSRIFAEGEAGAMGVRIWSDNGVANIAGGEIIAQSNGNSTGVVTGNIDAGDPKIADVRVVALGTTSGTGLLLNANRDPVFSGLSVEGSTLALALNGVSADFTLRGVHLKSGRRAFEYEFEGDSSVTFEQAVLRAPEAIFVRPESDLDIVGRSSVFAGTRSYGIGTQACTDVYDENYQPLNAQCQ